MNVRPLATTPAMPRRAPLDADDAPARWPLAVALFAALATAALVLFGVGRLFDHDAHVAAAGEPLRASGDAPPLDAPRALRTGGAARRMQASAAPRPFDPAIAAAVAAQAAAPDPQLARSRATTGGLDGGAGTFSGVTHRGRVAQVEGDAPVRAGAICDVRVLPVAAGGFNCLVRVVCDGALLYPDPFEGAGYVSCQVDAGGPLTAEDRGFTAQDGDPLLTFDAPSQRVVVGDGGEGRVRDYLATITLDGPRPFRRL
jgi:hypothetical protein